MEADDVRAVLTGLLGVPTPLPVPSAAEPWDYDTQPDVVALNERLKEAGVTLAALREHSLEEHTAYLSLSRTFHIRHEVSEGMTLIDNVPQAELSAAITWAKSWAKAHPALPAPAMIHLVSAESE